MESGNKPNFKIIENAPEIKKKSIFDEVKLRVDGILSGFFSEGSLKIEILVKTGLFLILVTTIFFIIDEKRTPTQETIWLNEARIKSNSINQEIEHRENSLLDLAKTYAKDSTIYNAIKNNIYIQKKDLNIETNGKEKIDISIKVIKSRIDIIKILNEVSDKISYVNKGYNYFYKQDGTLFATNNYKNKDILDFNQKIITEQKNTRRGFDNAMIVDFDGHPYSYAVTRIIPTENTDEVCGYVILCEKLDGEFIDEIYQETDEKSFLINTNNQIESLSLFNGTERDKNFEIEKLYNDYIHYSFELNKLENSHSNGKVILAVEKKEIEKKSNDIIIKKILNYLGWVIGLLLGAYVILSSTLKKVKKNQSDLKKINKTLSMTILLMETIVHDIKNPVAGILGFIRLMKTKIAKNTTNLNIDNYIDEIEKGANMINTLAMDFLESSKHLEINEKIDAKQIIDNLIKKNSGINIVNHISDDKFILGNYYQLEKSFQNFITNSSHAEKEDEQICIIIDLEEINKKQYCIIFKDNGQRIPPKILPKIFEPKFTTKIGGSGKGLATVKDIIEHHNGKIEVESTIGEGTTFKVFLPKTTKK